MNWKLWLDDQLDDSDAPMRHVPNGFIGARSNAEAINLVLKYGTPEFMDLDHDLGEENVMVFLRWLSMHDYDNVPGYAIHSANPVGRKNIESFMESWKKSLEIK